MNLQKRIAFTVTALLSMALIPTVAMLTWTARQSLLERAKADGVMIAQNLAQSANVIDRIPTDVEQAIGEQMLVQATIAAHLVAIAEQAGLSPDQINRHLQEITQKTVLNEFWITDSKGRAYLRNIAEIDFTFDPDPVKQPQAYVFWSLINGQKQAVVQEARKREADDQVFKYAGVAGIDQPRIVQVGYKAAFLNALREKVGLNRLINQLLEDGNVSAIWVVNQALQPIASGMSNDLLPSHTLNQAERSRLGIAIISGSVNAYIEGNFLKVTVPLANEQNQITRATLVYLPISSVHQVLQQQLLLSTLVAGIVLIIGLIASNWLSRWLTQPVLDLNVAAQSLAAGHWEQTVPVERGDELGGLARSFKQMAQQLQESFLALQTANFELEQRVEQRTQELKQANEEITKLNGQLQAENLRMGSELDIARRLQQMILPTPEDLQEITELDIAGFMEPADEVGGDYYDVLKHNDSIQIGIGDVTGHGLESGVVMLMAQTALRTLLAANETNPTKVLNVLNKIICSNTRHMTMPKNMTLTLLQYKAGVLHLSGQHEELIVIRQDGTLDRIDTSDLGFPLGIESDISPYVAQTEIQLVRNEVAVLYTDGITDAVNTRNELYGLERLHQVLLQNRDRDANGIRSAVIADVMQHIGDCKVFDDITLVVMKQK